jgi:hypothetical protein
MRIYITLSIPILLALAACSHSNNPSPAYRHTGLAQPAIH